MRLSLMMLCIVFTSGQCNVFGMCMYIIALPPGVQHRKTGSGLGMKLNVIEGACSVPYLLKLMFTLRILLQTAMDTTVVTTSIRNRSPEEKYRSITRILSVVSALCIQDQ